MYNLLTVDSSQNMIVGFLEDCREEMSNLSYYQSWQKALEKIPMQIGLNKDDREVIKQFGKNLGTTDIEGQLLHCKLYIELFTQKLKEAQIQKEKNVKLYRTLGLAMAMGLFILII